MRSSVGTATCAVLAVTALTSAARADGPPDANELPPVAAPTVPKPRNVDLGVSVMGGIGGGFSLMAGSVGEPVGPAGRFGLEVGARFYKHIYATIVADLTLFSASKQSAKSVSAWLLGVRGGWLTNPEGFGLFADLGVGYRNISIADVTGTSRVITGADFLLGTGLHFKLGDNVRLFLPRIDFAAGPAGGEAHYLFTLGLVAMFNYDVGRRPKHED